MIKHVVMFKMKESATKLIDIELIFNALNNLPSRIKEIKFFEVGKNIIDSERAFDMVLISEFENIEDLNIYRIHSEHQAVVQLIQKYCSETKVVDYMV